MEVDAGQQLLPAALPEDRIVRILVGRGYVVHALAAVMSNGVIYGTVLEDDRSRVNLMHTERMSIRAPDAYDLADNELILSMSGFDSTMNFLCHTLDITTSLRVIHLPGTETARRSAEYFNFQAPSQMHITNWYFRNGKMTGVSLAWRPGMGNGAGTMWLARE